MPQDPTATKGETAVIATLHRRLSGTRVKVLMGIVTCFTLAGLLFSFVNPTDALAWNNCPRGLVNDPYPGACRRYVDTNGDQVCDLSQSQPTASTTTASTTTTTVATTTKVSSTTSTLGTTTSAASGEPPTGNCPLGPCIGCRACISIAADVQNGTPVAALSTISGSAGSTTSGGTGSAVAAAATATGSTASAASTTGGSGLFTHYMVSPIAIGFLLIYSLSFFLYKTKRIRISTHRKIWNVLLLATFLITGIFGLILTIQLDYTLPFTLPINLLFWHVEAGIVMTLISLFHMGWHFNYYRNLLRAGRNKARAARAAERGVESLPAPIDSPIFAADERERRRLIREAERLRAARQGAEQSPARPPVAPRQVPQTGLD